MNVQRNPGSDVMQKPKSRRVENLISEIKAEYHRALTSIEQEALLQDMSVETIYTWANPMRSIPLPFHAVILSQCGDALLEYAHRLRHDKPYAGNGRIDDEWADISYTFALILELFKKGELYDCDLAATFRQRVEDLLSEWSQRKKSKE